MAVYSLPLEGTQKVKGHNSFEGPERHMNTSVWVRGRRKEQDCKPKSSTFIYSLEQDAAWDSI